MHYFFIIFIIFMVNGHVHITLRATGTFGFWLKVTAGIPTFYSTQFGGGVGIKRIILSFEGN